MVGRTRVRVALPRPLARAAREGVRPAGGGWGPEGETEIEFADNAGKGAAPVRLGEVGARVVWNGSRAIFSPPPRSSGRPDRIVHLHILPAISWVLARAGLLQIHAAGVVGPRGAILVVGRSGAGKSTLAGEFRGRGASPFSDDRALLWKEGDRVLASSSHEAPTPFTLWTRLDPSRVISGEVPLPRLAEDPPPAPVPLCAILFPRVVADEPSEMSPLTPRESATRLLTAYSFGDRPPEAVLDLIEAAARVPAFAVRSGRGLDALQELWNLVREEGRR